MNNSELTALSLNMWMCSVIFLLLLFTVCIMPVEGTGNASDFYLFSIFFLPLGADCKVVTWRHHSELCETDFRMYLSHFPLDIWGSETSLPVSDCEMFLVYVPCEPLPLRTGTSSTEHRWGSGVLLLVSSRNVTLTSQRCLSAYRSKVGKDSVVQSPRCNAVEASDSFSPIISHSQTTTWTEWSQKEKNKYHILTYTCGV